MTQPHHTSQFFTYAHLPEQLRPMSKRFADVHDVVVSGERRSSLRTAGGTVRSLDRRDLISELTEQLRAELPSNREAEKCFRKLHVAMNPGLDMAAQYDESAELDLVLDMLLEAKDCAVRALIAKEPS